MRTQIVVIPILLILGASAPVRAADSRRVDALIDELAQPDPALRRDAANKLLDLGPDIRPALEQAVRSDHPEIRAKAAELLRRLPWHLPDDPPVVRQALEGYGQRDEQERAQVVHNLAQPGRAEEVVPALLRVMEKEPSDYVRWEIARALRTYDDEASRQRYRQLEQTADRSAELFLAGWGWMQNDPRRARALFQLAVNLESAYPTRDSGQLSVAFQILVQHALQHSDWEAAAELYRSQATRLGSGGEFPQPLIPLLQLAIQQGDVDQVAELIRQQATHQQPGDEVSPPVFRLFVLHADHGPLPGFGQDMERYAAYLGRPLMLYALGRMQEKAGLRLEADALYASAHAANAGHAQLRLYNAELLSTEKWYDLAWSEATAALAMADARSYGIAQRAHELLSFIAAQRKDELAAAKHLELALNVAESHGNPPVGRDRDEVQAMVHWRRFRGLKEKDPTKAEEHAREILALLPREIEITMDIVPYLKEKGRREEADRLFKVAYDEMRDRVEKDPNNPEHQNNLAWLCARSDERLEEALKLSKQAVEAAPFNPAYLDTLAECYFRLGYAKRAVELEERALEIWPADEFMQEQLERFRAGL